MPATVLPIHPPAAVSSAPATVVPARFIDALAGHVAHNALFPTEAPLMLGILGPPGTGKSYQARELARQLSWKAVELSASSLAGEREGIVVQTLHEAYAQACDGLEHHAHAFLLIDDFDLTLASINDNVETSQHTQILRSALMELCDRPSRIASKFPMRVPIVLTANTLDAVYAPLIRYGRLHVFHWQPTAEELSAIVVRILAGLPDSIVKAIAERHVVQGLAFFRELRSETLKDLVITRIRRDGVAIADIRTADVQAEFCKLPLEHFDTIADRILRDREQLNYLRA